MLIDFAEEGTGRHLSEHGCLVREAVLEGGAGRALDTAIDEDVRHAPADKRDGDEARQELRTEGDAVPDLE